MKKKEEEVYFFSNKNSQEKGSDWRPPPAKVKNSAVLLHKNKCVRSNLGLCSRFFILKLSDKSELTL